MISRSPVFPDVQKDISPCSDALLVLIIVKKGGKVKGLERIRDYTYELPMTGRMRVPGRIYTSEDMLEQLLSDRALEQVANVATLPGITDFSFGMPDIHMGYGFPIGGVAAVDVDHGVVSPGGVGSDINCGVRLLKTPLKHDDIKHKIKDILTQLFHEIPTGIGKYGKITLSDKELQSVLIRGSRWAVENGYGTSEDLLNTEEHGALAGAKPRAISKRAFKRGLSQLGTLGSGNHFLEIQLVEKIYDTSTAHSFGLSEGDITIMIHTGSRGLGYQVCDDYAKGLIPRMSSYGIRVPDMQLACAPIDSNDGRAYISAMAGAANYAWANRQIITHWTRNVISEFFDIPYNDLELLYDVAHNIAKFERHRNHDFLVHRKGATRAFGPGRPELPQHYSKTGQPVIIPGDMGTASYILAGTDKAMTETFGSTCHGAGRVMSRSKALKTKRGEKVIEDLRKKGIEILAQGMRTVAEEMPEAYKSIDNVVDIVHNVGISKKIARLIPLGVIKG